MNKLKLQAKLIDLGVLEEDDTIRIEVSDFLAGLVGGVYITIISGLANIQSYYYSDNRLAIVEGNSVHISDIDIMRNLDLEEFE
jgi:hypothetical protein